MFNHVLARVSMNGERFGAGFSLPAGWTSFVGKKLAFIKQVGMFAAYHADEQESSIYPAGTCFSDRQIFEQLINKCKWLDINLARLTP